MDDFALLNALAIQVMLASIAVWAYWLHCWSRHRSPVAWRPREPLPWGISEVVLVGLIYVGLQALAFRLLKATLDDPQAVLVASVLSNGAAVVILPIVLIVASRCRLRDLGLSGGGLSRDAAYGLVGLLAAIVPALLVQAIVRRYLVTEVKQHVIVKLLQGQATPENWLLAGISAVVFAPVAEELVFRVVFQGWLEKHVHPAGAIAVSSVTFAAMHYASWPDPLPLLPLAGVLGYVYYRRHSLVAPVVVHATFNGLNLFILLFAPKLG